MHRPKVYRLYDHNPTAGISFVFFRLGRRMDSVGGCSREETRLDCEMIYEYSFSYPIKFCIRENPPAEVSAKETSKPAALAALRPLPKQCNPSSIKVKTSSP
mmetsp:Transcript_17969/g.25955  ORF Transcript_17969/g.25955 Transcript_17969/m.25955 type:complete len:102 (-) Transcript_17969:1102-1407(-)